MRDRADRVGQLLKEQIALIVRKELSFPEDVLVTVSRTEVSPDLAFADVYVSVMPEEKAEEVLKTLEKNVFSLQQKINKQFRIRKVPKMRFVQEKEVARAGRVEELLARIEQEREKE